MAHGPAGAPPRAPPSPLIRRLAPALYLCLILAPVIAQALLTIGQSAPRLPWTTLATVAVLLGLMLLTFTRAVGRVPILIAALAAGLGILILSGALIAAAAAAAVMIAAFAGGSILIRLLRPAELPPAEDAVYRFALGLGVTSYAMLALGLSGLLLPWAAVLVIAVPVVLARGDLMTAAGILRRLARLHKPGPAGPMLAAGIVWAIVVLVAAVAPEVSYDSTSYHLGLPRVWIDAGRMVDVPEQLQSYYYLAAEMNFTLAMLLAGPAAAKLLSFLSLALAVAAVYVVARSMFSSRAAAVAAALFATTPAIAWQGTTTYVDVSATLYVFLGSAAALRATRSGDARLAILAGALLGLAVATKLTALLAVAPILAFVAVRMLLPDAARGRRAAVVAASGLAFAAALAPWPILRYIQTGNPVFPLLNGIFRSPLWPQIDVVSNPAYSLDRFGLGKDPAAILATPLALSYAAERFDDAALGAGFGIALLLLPLALIGRRGSAEVRYLALISVSALVIWVLSVPYARYLLPVFGALTVLAAVGLDDLSRSAGGLAARIASSVPALLMAASLPLVLFMLPGASARIPYEVALGLETREAYLSRLLPTYDPLRLVASSTGAGSNVLLLSFHAGSSDDEDRLYAPGRVETVASLWTQDLIRIRDHAAALSAIRDRGFTHVYVNRRLVDAWARGAAMLDPAFFREHATLEYEKGGVELHRLR